MSHFTVLLEVGVEAGTAKEAATKAVHAFDLAISKTVMAVHFGEFDGVNPAELIACRGCNELADPSSIQMGRYDSESCPSCREEGLDDT